MVTVYVSIVFFLSIIIVSGIIRKKMRKNGEYRVRKDSSGSNEKQNHSELTGFAKYHKEAEDGNAESQMEVYAYYRDICKDYGESSKWLRKAAENGHPQGQALLALRLLEGREGFEKDEKEGLRFMKLAADNGYQDAILCYARYLLDGQRGLEKNPEEAVRLYKRGGEFGLWYCFYTLARNYEEGSGLPVNYEEAEKYYRKALSLEQDDTVQQRLAMMFLEGRLPLTDDNKKEVLALVSASAEKGNSEAECVLGVIYASRPDIVPPDYEKALDLLESAAGKGNDDAAYKLGLFFFRGYGGYKNVEQAELYIRMAANNEYGPAQCELACMIFNGDIPSEGDKDSEAFNWMKKAALNKYDIAVCKLGYMYEKGIGVMIDEEMAIKCYSHVSYIPESALALGQLYLSSPLYQDYNKAFLNIKYAADSGSVQAQYLLGELYTEGKGVEKDRDKAIACFEKAAAKNYSNAGFIVNMLKQGATVTFH